MEIKIWNLVQLETGNWKPPNRNVSHEMLLICSDVKTLDDPKNMKMRPKYNYLLPKKATKIRLLDALKGD